MTVSNPTRLVTYTGNGVTTVFPFTFLIPADTAVITLTTVSTGLEGSALVEGVDYSITGEDDEAGGSVTYPLSGSPLTSAYQINVKSILTPTQTLDLTNQSAYNPTQLELQLDRIVLVLLQLTEQLGRTFLTAPGEETSITDLLAAITAAVADAEEAAVLAVAAAESAATTNFPEPATALNMLRRNAGNTAYESRTPAQVLDDIGAVALAGDEMTGTLLLNKNAAAMLATGSSSLIQMQQLDDVNATLLIDGFGTGEPYIQGRRARTSKAAPSAMLTSNRLITLSGSGYGATAYTTARAEIAAMATQTWTDANNGSKWVVRVTPTNSATIREVAAFDQDGSFKLNEPLGGLGYSTGAGGTVTQATSKSTGVTLNKVCGDITMNNASLAGASIVSFTLTNSAIAAGDVLILNHVSGGTPGPYLLNAACSAGSAVISVRNASGSSLAEAIVLRFVLIRAVTA